MGISKAATAKARRDGAAHFEAGLPICNSAFDARAYSGGCSFATIRAAYEGGWRAAAEAAASKRRQEGEKLPPQTAAGWPKETTDAELAPHLDVIKKRMEAVLQMSIEAELLLGSIKDEAAKLGFIVAGLVTAASRAKTDRNERTET